MVNLSRLDTKKYKYCNECKKILPYAHFTVLHKKKNGTKTYKDVCKLCEDGKSKASKSLPETMRIIDTDGNIIITNDVVENDSINIKLISPFEVFTQVEDTYCYWISNYGRIVNNLRNPKKFHVHNITDHYTINHFEYDGGVFTYDEKTDDLMAKHFLKPIKGKNKIWHIDGDKNNYYYKNLICVSIEDYQELTSGNISVDDLDYKQEYIEYPNKARALAYQVYNAIYTRCYDGEEKDSVHKCYDGAYMCQKWLDDPESFVDWFLDKMYYIPNESMAVDKDLFGNGSKMYGEETCCILPQVLNTMLTNCKKHDNPLWKDAAYLPLGVRYNEKTNMYHGEITLFGQDETVVLDEWTTPEEAFAEYKDIKQKDIFIMATRYRNYLPRETYEALIKYDVKPYIEE